MVYTEDLKFSAVRLAGSNPAPGNLSEAKINKGATELLLLRRDEKGAAMFGEFCCRAEPRAAACARRGGSRGDV